MNNDLKDILSNSNKDIDNQQLMDYLSNQLSKADSHEIEKNMVIGRIVDMTEVVSILMKSDTAITP